MRDLLLIFVHGYSVSNFETYGGLPARLKAEAAKREISLEVADLFLARYISFNGHVTLDDLSSAMEAALSEEIYPRMNNRRFICISHSTGGPLVRNWLRLHYPGGKQCPMSHLLMLAPANHGSALAQLGKSKAGRIRAWFNGVDPGQKILDWLELGSSASWALNKAQLTEGHQLTRNGVFLFVITGQDIDRKLYDHINSYTGEPGSDGVVRVASANLNNSWIHLEQQLPEPGSASSILKVAEFRNSDSVPFRIVARKSHSDPEMGIMRSVSADTNDTSSTETIETIFACIQVQNAEHYHKLAEGFAEETAEVQRSSVIETEQKITGTRYYIHDRHAMIIFRVRDSLGHVVSDYDMLLTSGVNNDPDLLPSGFFRDRQCNCRDHSTLTYYLNYDLMKGSPPIIDRNGTVIRPAQAGAGDLGLMIIARPEKGIIRYLPAILTASPDNLEMLLRPNATTLVDVTLRRLLSTEAFRIVNVEKATGEWDDKDAGDRFIA